MQKAFVLILYVLFSAPGWSFAQADVDVLRAPVQEIRERFLDQCSQSELPPELVLGCRTEISEEQFHFLIQKIEQSAAGLVAFLPKHNDDSLRGDDGRRFQLAKNQLNRWVWSLLQHNTNSERVLLRSLSLSTLLHWSALLAEVTYVESESTEGMSEIQDEMIANLQDEPAQWMKAYSIWISQHSHISLSDEAMKRVLQHLQQNRHLGMLSQDAWFFLFSQMPSSRLQAYLPKLAPFMEPLNSGQNTGQVERIVLEQWRPLVDEFYQNGNMNLTSEQLGEVLGLLRVDFEAIAGSGESGFLNYVATKNLGLPGLSTYLKKGLKLGARVEKKSLVLLMLSGLPLSRLEVESVIQRLYSADSELLLASFRNFVSVDHKEFPIDRFWNLMARFSYEVSASRFQNIDRDYHPNLILNWGASLNSIEQLVLLELGTGVLRKRQSEVQLQEGFCAITLFSYENQQRSLSNDEFHELWQAKRNESPCRFVRLTSRSDFTKMKDIFLIFRAALEKSKLVVQAGEGLRVMRVRYQSFAEVFLLESGL